MTTQDVNWADLILVMEQEHKVRLKALFKNINFLTIDSLDIPNEYKFMNQELVDLIREGTELYLQLRFGLKYQITKYS